VAYISNGVFTIVVKKKEINKMKKITQALKKFVFPFFIAQLILVVFFAGWVYLWIG
jgi:hypothetical protein